MIDSKPKFSRRQVVKGIAAVAGAPLAIPYFAPSLAANNEPIRLSVVVAQLPDFTDYLNGAQLAADEINAAGGVRGREIQVVRNDIDLWTVEGTQAGMRAIADLAAPRDRVQFPLFAHPGHRSPGRLEGAVPDRRHQHRADRIRQEEPGQILEFLPSGPT
ncbi:hypothetical protein ACVDG8_037465 (plasmid) [Mesorhizobium sp. ORM8.1]